MGERVGLTLILIQAGLPALQAGEDTAAAGVCGRGTQYAADRGDRNAQYNLGLCYFEGTSGLPQNDEQAELNLRRAANQGFDLAQYQLAVLLDRTGTEAEATPWYRHAAEAGHAGAQFNLGVNYKQGIGVEPSLTEATAWFEKAADQGHGDAAFICARHYGRGQGVDKDMGMAVHYMKVAAENGNDKAQFNLGMFFHRGIGIAADLAAAVRWYRAAASNGNGAAAKNLELMLEELGEDFDAEDEQGEGVVRDTSSGNPLTASPKALDAEQLTAEYDAGVAAMERGRFENAVRRFTRAAEVGHPGAQFKLGDCYLKGLGVPTVTTTDNRAYVDRSVGVGWLKQAAAQRHPEALLKLASVHLKGEVVEKDFAAAADHLRTAVAAGSTEAKVRLGLLLIEGVRVPRDIATAVQLLESAAVAMRAKSDGAGGHGQSAAYALARLYAGQFRDAGGSVLRADGDPVVWLAPLAEVGYPPAVADLALRYKLGDGVVVDVARGCELVGKLGGDAGTTAATVIPASRSDQAAIARVAPLLAECTRSLQAA